MNRRKFLAGCGMLEAASILRSPIETHAQQLLADVSLTIAPLELEIAPGKMIHTIAYNGSVPGPLIRWPQGKPIMIDVLNRTSEPEIVHWHGLWISSDMDGAMEEGVFYESLNIAKLWQLPLIFLMENNYRRAGHSGSSHSAKELSNVPRALNVATTVVDGGDVGAMYKTTSELVRRIRAGEGPFFVEAQTHPWPGNDGAHPKLVAGLTSIGWAWDAGGVPDAVRSWYAQGDPVLIFARELVKEGGVSRDEIQRLDETVRKEADAAARFALESPLPDPKAALNFDYAGRGN